MPKPVTLTQEHYCITWHSFDRETPPQEKPILCKHRTGELKDARWHVIMGKVIYINAGGWRMYVSQVKHKHWVWATEKDIRLIQPAISGE